MTSTQVPFTNNVFAGGYLVEVSTRLTHTAVATQYASGQVVFQSSVAANSSLMAFPAGRVNGGTGLITSALMSVVESNNSTRPSAELWLFNSTSVGTSSDYAVWAPGSTLLTGGHLVGIIPFTTFYDASTISSGSVVSQATALNIDFVCNTTSQNLYGVMVMRAAHTPTSSESFTFTLKVRQD